MIAQGLAAWAVAIDPGADDVALASRSLQDTLAVTIAARNDPIREVAATLGEAGYWATLAHVIDFDDLHLPSTAHISAVCVPAALATGGGAREYLAAAGVMARIGSALGWGHYSAGWHATTTAGPFGAAVAAGLALGLDAERLAVALALCVPAAGGVQRAFGTQAKSLQVGMAVEAGIQAARLAAAGASADLAAIEDWMTLVGGRPERVDRSGPLIPGGLAIKLFPACYALQRPIVAIREARGSLPAEEVSHLKLTTPRGTVAPLRHHRPATGLQGKFSLEYAAATALLDEQHGFSAFSDEAVQRADAQRIVESVEIELIEGGDGLLDGEVVVELGTRGGQVRTARLGMPPGSPDGPPAARLFADKLNECLHGSGIEADDLSWSRSGDILRGMLPRA